MYVMYMYIYPTLHACLFELTYSTVFHEACNISVLQMSWCIVFIEQQAFPPPVCAFVLHVVDIDSCLTSHYKGSMC